MNFILAHGDRIEGRGIILIEGKSIDMTENKKKIYCFINGSNNFGQHVMALCEDGNVLAGHLSSSVGYAKHDIGINSDWKHDKYKEHCPEGYELEWVDPEDVNGHDGIDAAYILNQELAKAAKPETV